MVRLVLVGLALAPVVLAQTSTSDAQFHAAGVCARCHVISVVEWGLSGHRAAGTDCIACHGVSKGHVADERNNIKPERIPHEAAIAGLCGTCHAAGCPKSKERANCQTCHHPHALVNPKKTPSGDDPALTALTAKWKSAAKHRDEGERLARAGEWAKAGTEFRQAMAENPLDTRSREALALCERRLHPSLTGFESFGGAMDESTGLPREVKVAGLGIDMVLVPGGDAEVGSESFAASKPVHSVLVAPFYLARFEMSQAEWKRLMGANPSAKQDDRLPVEQVSWNDAQRMIEKLNATVPGGGFRLPTEVEWEYAARAGGPQEGWSGAWGKDGAPRVVNSGVANRYGLHNLRGNVWEWCSSLYTPYPYDAADGREDPAAQGLRVLRGGGFADSKDLLDPALRHSERPDRRLRWNGVRIARTVPGL